MNEGNGIKIIVGIGDFKVARETGVLETASLGSCVGIAIYDPLGKIGGLAHILLPNSMSVTPALASPTKYADTAIKLMVEEMLKQGAKRHHLYAKIAGGACMFDSSITGDDILRIGEKNVDAVRKSLEQEHIKIVAEDVGKNYGRTMTLDVTSGNLTVRSSKIGAKQI